MSSQDFELWNSFCRLCHGLSRWNADLQFGDRPFSSVCWLPQSRSLIFFEHASHLGNFLCGSQDRSHEHGVLCLPRCWGGSIGFRSHPADAHLHSRMSSGCGGSRRQGTILWPWWCVVLLLWAWRAEPKTAVMSWLLCGLWTLEMVGRDTSVAPQHG